MTQWNPSTAVIRPELSIELDDKYQGFEYLLFFYSR